MLEVQGKVPFTAEELEYNIRDCLKRDLPEMGPWIGPPHEGKLCIVGSGPSIEKTLPKLRAMKAKGAKVYAVNSAADLLVSRGIVPDVHYLLDASDQVLRFIKTPHKDIEYLVASHCHPKVFDRLDGFKVTIHHAHMNRNEIKIMDERDKKRDEEGLEPLPSLIIPGGSTAALRLFFIGMNRGYTDYHLFGIDSSYGKKKTHADRDEKQLLTTVKSRVTKGNVTTLHDASLQMHIQAQDFEIFVNNFGMYVTMFCYGNGLIQSLWRKHYDKRTGRPKCLGDFSQGRSGPNHHPRSGRERARLCGTQGNAQGRRTVFG